MLEGDCNKLIRKQISLEELTNKIENEKYPNYFRLIECIVNNTHIENAKTLSDKIEYIFYLSKKTKDALDISIDDALKNMILFNSRGNFTWSIENKTDLENVLELWNIFFPEIDNEYIYNFIMKKHLSRFNSYEWLFIKRMQSVFPDLSKNDFRAIEKHLPRRYQEFEMSIYYYEVSSFGLYLNTLTEKELMLFADNFHDTVVLDSGYTEWMSMLIMNKLFKTCVICSSEDSLEVHHIQYVKNGGSNELSNLVVLCHVHHKEVHKKD